MTEPAGRVAGSGLAIARTVIAMRRAAERCWHSSPSAAPGCVLLEWAARRATRQTLTLAARRIVAAHWPTAGGGCPLCVTPDCPAFLTAAAYLDLIGDSYLPLPARSASRPLLPAVSESWQIRARGEP
ncbi:hypothetical protein AAH979_17180 [Plantactinospora sp. ZYX-F-223]|uniref:hypothetical protein n=1 Tax=Plantactinospora sp. ZYX-F-223 TaxID=3144103 RepID=UPI0031FD9B9F